jgi:hypothetical protein
MISSIRGLRQKIFYSTRSPVVLIKNRSLSQKGETGTQWGGLLGSPPATMTSRCSARKLQRGDMAAS